MEFRALTDKEKTLLKLGVMELFNKGFISEMAAEWLIQSLGLSDA